MRDRAAQEAGLGEFVAGLPAGPDTMVGEGGLPLSSGELQKIALARVLLRDAPVIVFDEFTRSIDEVSRQALFAAIRQLTGRTIIIVTHHKDDIGEGGRVTYLKKVH